MSAVQEKRDQEAEIIELIRGLALDLTLLARQEAELARKELANAARAFTIRMGALCAGVLIALYGAFFLFFSAIFGIGTVLPVWASALIIGGGLAGFGVILILLSSIALSRLEAMPRTTRTLRENREWLRRAKERSPK